MLKYFETEAKIFTCMFKRGFTVNIKNENPLLHQDNSVLIFHTQSNCVKNTKVSKKKLVDASKIRICSKR